MHGLEGLEEVERQIEEGLQAVPLDTVDEDIRFQTLSQLSPVEYDRARKAAAIDLGISVATLDAEVNLRRSDERANARQGRSVNLREFEPWHEEVDGAEVLDSISAAIQERIHIPPAYADVCTLWIAHTHMYDAFQVTPRLLVTAPEPECGKTNLAWYTIGCLVPKPMLVESVSPAAYFRLADKYQPTFIIDEVDQFLKQDSDLVSSLNSGVSAGGSVPRCSGDDHEVRCYRTHSPVLIGGIDLLGKLPPATVSRCIVIPLDRAPPEVLDRLRSVMQRIQKQKRKVWLETGTSEVHDPELEALGRMLSTWINRNRKRITKLFPDTGLIGRDFDKWEPLFAIAEAVGGDWPKRCQAGHDAPANKDVPTASRGLELLSDIREASVNDAKIWTEVLIDRLRKDQDKRWANYNFRNRDNSNITPRQLYMLLQPYGVKQQQVFIDGTNRRGFHLSQFKNVFERYLPPLPEQNAQTSAIQRRRRRG